VVKKCFSESEQAELDPYAMMYGIDLRSHSGYALLNIIDKVQVDEAIDFFHNFGIIGDRYYGDDGQERFRSYDDAESLRNDFILFGAMRRRIISRNPDDLSDFAQWSRGTSRESAAAWLYAAALDFVTESAYGESDLVEDSRLVLRHFEIIFQGVHSEITMTSQKAKVAGKKKKTRKTPKYTLKDKVAEIVRREKNGRSVIQFLHDWKSPEGDKEFDGIDCVLGDRNYKFSCGELVVEMSLENLQKRASKKV
jgi:hypothetical protein